MYILTKIIIYIRMFLYIFRIRIGVGIVKKKFYIYLSLALSGGMFLSVISGIKVRANEVKNMWKFEEGSWKYYDTNSKLQTGWLCKDDKWYFLNPNMGKDYGKMLNSWQWVDGKCYYFDLQTGVMYKNSLSPDGYKLGNSGAWIDENNKEYFVRNKGFITNKHIVKNRIASYVKSASSSLGYSLESLLEKDDIPKGKKLENLHTASEALKQRNDIKDINKPEKDIDSLKDNKKENVTDKLVEKIEEENKIEDELLDKKQVNDENKELKGENTNQVDKKLEEEKIEETTGLPMKYDLRNVKGKSYVTEVKNQYYDGGCRSFAVLAALESHIKLKEGIDLDLSENNMENRQGFIFRDKGVKLGIREGRNRESDLPYLISGRGPILEEDDVYRPLKHEFNPAAYLTDEGKKYIEDISKKNISKNQVEVEAKKNINKKAIRSILGFEFLKSLDVSTITSNYDEQMKQIKKAIIENGAVVSNIYMAHDGNKTFPYSNELTYNPLTKAYCSLEEANPNHAIAIVGWDDNFSKENFQEENRPDIDGAWIVKDAQTKYFGDEGYFYVSFKSRGICNEPYVFTDVRKADEFKGVYQYDDYGLTGFIRNDELSGEAKTILFNKYKVDENNRILDSVGFYTTKPNAEYEIYFIEDFDSYIEEVADEGFSDEKEVVEKLQEDNKKIMFGNLASAGYHTLELPIEHKLKLAKGKNFAIGLYVKNDDNEDPEHKWDMAIELNDKRNPNVNYGANAKVGNGETYTISFGEINDLKMLSNSTGKEINACIKVYYK